MSRTPHLRTLHPATRAVAAAGVSLAVLAGISACGAGSSSGGAAAGVPTTAAANGVVTPAAAGPATAARTMAVTETEFHIALASTSVSPGTYLFTVHNAGKIGHALLVQGPGLDSAHTSMIAPGGDASMTVTLIAGTYTIVCPVGNHAMLGMSTTLTVA